MQNQNMNPQMLNQQQAGMQKMQANRMPEPPKVITNKDLSYLADALSWELDVIKKINHFAEETQDAKTKNMMKRAAQIHQKHYSILLKHLSTAGTNNPLTQ